MKAIYVNQVGFFPGVSKKAMINFDCDKFAICSQDGKAAFDGKVSHFGTDEISGEDIYVADFSSFCDEGTFYVEADGVRSASFEIGKNVYDKLMKDLCKCYYFLRCGDALSEKYAGVYYHKPCHTSLATVYGEEDKKVERLPRPTAAKKIRTNDQRRLSYKEKCELEKLMPEIEALEQEKATIETALCSGTLTVEEITNYGKRLPQLTEEIEAKTLRWMELSEIAEGEA